MSRRLVSRRARVLSALCAGFVACFASVAAGVVQTIPQATNLAALAGYPDFYVDRTVVVRGQLHDLNGRLSIEDGEGHRVIAVWKGQARPDGPADMTGVLWDLGRMKQDDPRLTGYDLASVVGAGGEAWPLPGQVFVFAAQKFVPADTPPATAPTIRSLVLEGPRAAGRQVTVVGQFHGRNLFGDLPRAPGLGRWDFVIQAAGAAIWVTGVQPVGKDFDFDSDKRIDSNHWLQVTGTVREERGLMLIQATKLVLSKPDTTEPSDAVAQPRPVPPAAPPAVLFSVPVDGETDVSPNVVVRIQLSRTLDRATLANRMRASYVAPPGGQTTQIPAAHADLEESSEAPGGAIAVLRISFAQPLERFRTVRIDLLDGIKAPDGQPLKPFQLTFTVGGE